MPDISKKKSPPPGGRLSSSKNKQVASPQVLVVEEIPVYNPVDPPVNADPEEHPPVIIKPPTPPPPDLMREEPVLSPLIVESYEGETDKNDFYHGFGSAKFVGGNIFKGSFCYGKMHGHGTYSWSDGTIYIGDFKFNSINGKGAYSWPDGSRYDGEVLNGLRHGFGVFSTSGRQQSYQGEWMEVVSMVVAPPNPPAKFAWMPDNMTASYQICTFHKTLKQLVDMNGQHLHQHMESYKASRTSVFSRLREMHGASVQGMDIKN